MSAKLLQGTNMLHTHKKIMIFYFISEIILIYEIYTYLYLVERELLVAYGSTNDMMNIDQNELLSA